MSKYLLAAATSCLATAIATANAHAATTPATSEGHIAPIEEVVVTGTYLRGVAPTGANSILLDRESVKATGVTNTAQLLSTVPSAGMLNTNPSVRGDGGSGFSLNRPDLRGLQSITGAASSTLLLLDGHRLPGMGILQNGPDADMLPLGALERVEIVTDGGSAVYGSDAVGGVVNYVTRRAFDGASVSAKHGFTDNYEENSADITVGKSWDGGSAFVAYSYVEHDAIYGRDRDYVKPYDWPSTAALGQAVGSDRSCNPGTVSIGGKNYALPNLTTDALNLGQRCSDGNFTIYPKETKNSVFARLTLDNGGPVSFTLPIFYMERENTSDSGPLERKSGFRVSSSSGSYIPVPGASGTETIFTNFGEVLGNSAPAKNTLETYGLTPTLEVDIANDWRMTLLGNYGYGAAELNKSILNAAPINSAISAGTFDFTNIASPANAAALALASDWRDYGEGINEIKNARAVFDGPLFHIPGGEVQMAIGGEYSEESYELQQSAGVTTSGIHSLRKNKANRDVSATFLELNIPIIGEGNRGMFHSLNLSAAGRHDDYSDFGSTTNMRYAVDFEPVDWLNLRASVGESFQAPALSDIALGSSPAGRLLAPVTAVPIFQAPGVAPAPTGANLAYAITGTQTPLNPQEADILSYGFDVDFPLVDGLTFGATYYEIEFREQIGNPPFGGNPNFFSQFPDNYAIYKDGSAAMTAFRDQMAAIINNPADLLSYNISDLYIIVDGRKQNLGTTRVEGVDVYANYHKMTDWGRYFVNVSANRPTVNENAVSNSAPFLDSDTGPSQPRLRSSLSVGAEAGRLRGQITWNHTGAYNVTPNASNLMQNRVDAYNLYNLGVQYDLTDWVDSAEETTLTFNVDNLMDEDPPLLRSNRGYENGQTLGRLFRVGISTKF